MLKMTVDISGLLRLIQRKVKKFRMHNGGISRRDEQRIAELLILRFICRDDVRVKRLSSPDVNRITDKLTHGDHNTSGDHELLSELHYYGEMVGDMVMRYFDYVDDYTGYDCDVFYELRRRRIVIEGRSECLRERLGR